METVIKPWGSYTNLIDDEHTKVKKIVIKPGESPSYQYHHKRREVWIITQGTLKVRLNDVYKMSLSQKSTSRFLFELIFF